MLFAREEWARAYAKQSYSDYLIYETLASISSAKECHRLHYLQMACEKIAKAYGFRDTAASVEGLLTSHIAFSKYISLLLKSPELRTRYRRQDEKLLQISRFARKLAREIEKLAPAVDRGQSPENEEYPWIDGQQIIIPCEYSYPNLKLLTEPGGRNFLKIVKIAIENFDDHRSPQGK